MKSLVLLTLLVTQNLWAGLEVGSLNQKLQQQQAGWTAKKTWLSDLSAADARHAMGLKRAPSEVEFVAPPLMTRSNLPAVLDWRNKDGKNWISPVLNQANCGSCVAFASIGALESQFRIASAFPNFNVKLSPQNLFSCGGGACDYGWMPDAAAHYLQSTGVPDESCMPYLSGATGEDVACQATCPDTSKRSMRIANYSTPTRGSKNVEAVKQGLQQGPLVTTLTVYEDFMSYASGVYKHVKGSYLGGHAVSIVGYDDTQRAFIIRNSWGADWGMNGFAYVSYDDISGIGEETWSYSVPSLNGAVSIVTPDDYSYVSGQLNIQSYSSFPSTDSVTVTLFNQSKAMLTATCQATSTCNSAMDVASLADGRYEVQAIAMNSRGEQVGSSTRHIVYVANQKPTLALSFTGKDVDLNQKLKQRIEFNVTTTSTSVPMSGLEFHFVGPDGKEQIRHTSIVIPEMTLGWRTNLVPNGTYEIWMVGHVKTNSFDAVAETTHMHVQLLN